MSEVIKLAAFGVVVFIFSFILSWVLLDLIVAVAGK